MAGQQLLTRSQRHIAGSIIYCGTEFIEVLPQSTLRDPKKPISHQVRQIYGGCRRRGSGGAARRQLLAGSLAVLRTDAARGDWLKGGLEPLMLTIKLQ